MKSLHQIISALEVIVDNHPELQSFKVGPMEDIDIEKLNQSAYPLLYLEYGEVTIDRGLATYGLTLIVATLYDEEEGERTDVNVDLLNPLHDVMNSFIHAYSDTADGTGNMGQAHIDLRFTTIETPFTATPFWAQYDNHLTGWSVDFDVTVNNDNSLCQALQEQ